MKPKTVLLVAGAAGFSTRDVWEGYRQGLSKLGVQVIPYPTFSMLKLLSGESVGNDIVGKAHDVRNRVDAVVFIDGMHFQGERSWVPLTLRQSGLLTAVIKTDDPYSPIPDAHHYYDVVCTNELASKGDHEFYLPTATAETPDLDVLRRDADEDERSDIVFVGTMFEDRMPMMVELANCCEAMGLRLRMAGNFPAETSLFKRSSCVHLTRATVRPESKWKMYANSRMVINLFRQSDDAVSPNPRVFEVTALGGPALLTGPRRGEVTKIFADCVYQFDNAEEMRSQIAVAMQNETDRKERVAQARQITFHNHLYEHRSGSLLAALAQAAGRKASIRVNEGPLAQIPNAVATSPSGEVQREQPTIDETRLAWIIGCGRTGSTWLCEMLDALPQMHGWHEPYFGRLLKHLADQPDERRRPPAFFFDGYRKAWIRGLRDAFYRVALNRYPGFSEQALLVKEVNTPEFFPLIEEIFPSAGLILLLRDPFDVLDSYIDMRKEGSWNRSTGKPFANSAEHLALHIADSFGRALEAFEHFTPQRKVELRYEQMLRDPQDAIASVCRLVGLPVSREAIDKVVADHRFETHSDTGPRAFRRFGQAGIWRRSGNFDSETMRVAESVLGDLRNRIGYS